MRVVAGVLQRFDEECLVGIRDVARELTHLIGLPTVGVLIGYGQHLICLQCSVQRDVAHGGVDSIF